MPKYTEIKKFILNELKENNELTRKKIVDNAYSKTSSVSRDSARKTVNKYLYEHLEEGNIVVVGYDSSLSKNINADGIIFALADRGPVCLTNLISVLNDLKRGDTNYNKLRAFFYNKTKELEDEFQREWEIVLEGVTNRELEVHEMLWIEAIKDMNSNISNKPTYILERPSNNKIIEYLHNNKEYYNENLQEILKKYKDKKLWYFKDEDPDIQNINAIKIFIDNHIFDEDGMTKEIFLIKTGLYKNKPAILSEKAIDERFEQTILYINSKPEMEKNNLINRLAYSLGSDKNSTTRFQNLMEEIQEKTKTHLDEVLDIIERSNKR